MDVFHEQIEQLFDDLDVAAKRYPIKALVCEIPDKAESTLRNELIRQPGFKLGLVTALWIILKTGDTTALDRIERMFDRVAVPIPEMEDVTASDLVRYAGEITGKTGEVLTSIGKAMNNDTMNAAQKGIIQEEAYEAMTALAGLWMFLKRQ